MSSKPIGWGVLSLFVALVIVYLIGNESVALWDRDEPRYAQTSRQMLQSGDWVVPYFLDTVRTKKPVFIYWCQASAMSMLGDTAFAARLPSVIAMVLVLGMLLVAIRRAVDGPTAIWTAFILGSSALGIATAKMAMTDAVLLLWITLSQLCLFVMIYRGLSWTAAVVMGIAVGLAGLTKGPVVLGVMGMTLLALGLIRLIDRRWKPAPATLWLPKTQRNTPGSLLLKTLLIVAVVAVIVGPWLYLIEQRYPGYTIGTLQAEVFERARRPQEGHKGPPGYYLLTIWGTFFPWSIMLPAAVLLAWKQRAEPIMRFALAATLGPWVMFEIVQTKLPHYLMPVYPALAFMVANLILRAHEGATHYLRDKGSTRVMAIWAIVVAIVSAGPLAGAIALKGSLLLILAGALLWVVGCVYAWIVFRQFRKPDPIRGSLAMGVGFLVFVSVLMGLYLPRADFLRISPQVAKILKEHGATVPGQVMMIDYKEPSLAFYQGGTIREQRLNRFLQETPQGQWPTWIVLTDRIWRDTPPEIQEQWEILGSVRGINYAGGGRRVEVMVLQRR